MLPPPSSHWNTDQTMHFLVVAKNMANGTKGWGKPLPLDSHPVGDRLPVPHTPLGVLRFLVTLRVVTRNWRRIGSGLVYRWSCLGFRCISHSFR